ncbi:hypothetical protein E4U21_003751 [Claviceps maximensis]|nr:hypothetical protein E4U21_003751 [Claviceps maximensis]
MSSASALAFSFMGVDNTKSITIKVPFQHLNLTLEPPLVETSTPYFPCSTGGTGSYVLGRAFLQDAFVAGNWHKNTWWLAQAPGPNIPRNPDLAAISPDDYVIRGNGNDWISSWDRLWTSVSASGDSIEPIPSSAPTTLTRSNLQPGLSIGATAGIGAGIGIVLLVLVGLLIGLCWQKRQHQRHAVEECRVSCATAEAKEQKSMRNKHNQQSKSPVQSRGDSSARCMSCHRLEIRLKVYASELHSLSWAESRAISSARDTWCCFAEGNAFFDDF